jgi:peroxisomal membrane protein 4
LLLQKKLNGGKERDLDSLIAGGLGGWWVFGERTAVRLFYISSSLLDLDYTSVDIRSTSGLLVEVS